VKEKSSPLRKVVVCFSSIETIEKAFCWNVAKFLIYGTIFC